MCYVFVCMHENRQNADRKRRTETGRDEHNYLVFPYSKSTVNMLIISLKKKCTF